MTIEDFKSIEFGVCALIDNEEYFYRIPIDDSVRETLVEMIDEFYEAYMGIAEDAEDFQPSEKYAATEKLRIDLDHENLDSLRQLYQKKNIPVSQANFSEMVNTVSYYFAVFKHRNGAKQIAVKRPAQFKGLLKKKLVRIIDDTLSSVPDDIFKLDHDFDFVIHENEIDILHPSGFIFISDLDEEIMASAVQSTRQLSTRIGFINFDAMTDFVGRSKTAAKLVASIKSRVDLERTSQQKLVRTCRTLEILFRKENGQIIPEESSMIDFLQLLDRREYEVDLTDDAPEVYVAGSRKKKE